MLSTKLAYQEWMVNYRLGRMPVRNSLFNCKSKVVYNPLSSAALISEILLLSFGMRTNTAIFPPFFSYAP